LKLPEKEIETLMSDKGKSYVIVASKLTKAQADSVSALKNGDFHLATSVERQYLKGPLAAQVLGYVGYDGYERVGQYGVESYYDNILNGQNRTQLLSGNQTYATLAKTITSKISPDQGQTSQQTDIPEGEDITLTIDPNIQSFAETKLEELIHHWSASGGNIIVQDPKTGYILAMASSPSFDPNNYGSYDTERFLNSATQKVFEPGSSFKAITMSAGIDVGAIRPTTTFVDTGPVKVGDYTIKNATDKIFGTVTMTQVLENSLNTGSMFAEEKTGNDNFLKYVTSFGFGQKTGIDSAGEVSGTISGLYSGRRINFDTASFGQGVAVTPIQLINAYSAIANNGRLMKPILVGDVQHHDGTVTKTKPTIIDVPITESTAHDLIGMLTAVVDHHLTAAQIPGYDIAAKTGTAQIPDQKGGYEAPDQVIHNIVGFAPARQARFTLLIKIDRPKGVKFSAESLSPPFAEISRFLLRYLGVPPTRQ
jgi:cell division protein FtsI/penicillin-binding protein 2